MVLADTSQTARTRRLKARIIAGWRSANPGKPEQGPGGQTTDYTTTYIASRLGNKPFYGVGVEGTTNPPGSAVTGCGCVSIVPTTITINACGKTTLTVVAGVTYTFINTFSGVGYDVTVTWLDSANLNIDPMISLTGIASSTKEAPVGAVSVAIGVVCP
jgi:hypothetical protein